MKKFNKDLLKVEDNEIADYWKMILEKLNILPHIEAEWLSILTNPDYYTSDLKKIIQDNHFRKSPHILFGGRYILSKIRVRESPILWIETFYNRLNELSLTLS